MTQVPEYPGGIWLLDFEFRPAHGVEGNPPAVLCMVAREYSSGRTLRLWQDDLARLTSPPFPIDDSSLVIAYYASAEISCFIQLGWQRPTNLVDLFIEFRWKTNGLPTRAGNGLIGALVQHGLDSMAAEEKDSWRDVILAGGPWNASQRLGILDYCESDVEALSRLFSVMKEGIDWPRALLRGRYACAIARVETNGIPIDTDTLATLRCNWQNIQHSLIATIDSDFKVYDGTTFKTEKFECLLRSLNIGWPRLPTGALDMQDATFRDMARTYPRLSALRELRSTLSQMRLSSLQVGGDSRNRCLMSMFRSQTGRNQPSSSKFIFGASVWMRGLVQPPPRFGIAYVDWSQQELGIAGALSGDEQMMLAYHSGDPYLEFAKQAGAVPTNATKESHPTEREQFKACSLAVNYGMAAEGLAYRINKPIARARQLLELHRRTYCAFWDWSEAILNQATLGGRLWTSFGWQLLTDDKPNGRSLRNFPMQANGSEMLRLACIRLIQDNVAVCAMVHDAVLIEAPLPDLDDAVEHTKSVMRAASAAVLGGFQLNTDVKIVRAPGRFMDQRGVGMWNLVMDQLSLPDRKVQT